MKSDLAIATLIRSRMTELGLSRSELSKRLGYKNIAKGIRRIDALCEGDLEGTKQFLDAQPREIELAEKQKAEAIICQVVDELFHDWELGQGFGYPARVLVFIGRAADRISRATRQKFATDVAIAPQFSKAAHWPDSFRRNPLRPPRKMT